MNSANPAYKDKPDGYFYYERPEMLQFIPDDVHSVLEIGCGTGAFGALVIKARGCRYTGVELMESEAVEARSRLDEVIVADVEQTTLPLQIGSFDCLVCNDVLEHLVDPWSALGRLVRFVRPSGYVVISIPNVRFSEVVKELLVRDNWEYGGQGVLDRTHLRFFTKRTVRSLLESAGAEVLRIEGINGIRFAWRLQFLNILLLGSLSPLRYPQYGVTARVNLSTN